VLRFQTSSVSLATIVLLGACTKYEPQVETEQKEVSEFSRKTTPWFEDATAALGLNFKHDSGATGTYFMPESIGSGGALFDFDNDGRLDIYLVHNALPNSESKNRLYRQGADGRFHDVSEGSGLDVTGYGMGVAAGDVNNDGLPDLLLAEYGKTRLFHNRGGGRFEDVTSKTGIDNMRWGTAAAFFDYDRDGWLDLVIVNYVDYSHTVKCYDTRGMPEYCGPQGIQGTASRLYHNLGKSDGSVRFEDVSVTSGLARKTGASLGVFCADFDGDHWPDIFIADDGMPNRLYINQRNGTFNEEAVQRGIAYNAFGSPAANMGIACGDIDSDGLFDIFITHLSWEQHGLWKQGPVGLFQDKTAATGLGNLARRGTGFGTLLADFDCDGALDLAMVNGRIKRGTDSSAAGKADGKAYLKSTDPFWRPYAERNHLLANDGSGQFRDISDANPAFCGQDAVGRGLACGDVDNDGDLDLLVMNTGGPTQLFRNVATNRGHWLVVRAIDPALGGRDTYGAEITLKAGPRQWRRLIQPGYSFLVSNDPRVHFGLGEIKEFNGIEVVWPDGVLERFAGGRSNRLVVLRKGTGTIAVTKSFSGQGGI
jgi:hypothetical protein